MADEAKQPEFKVGDELTTIHGEKIVVEKVETDRHGLKVLAQSGDNKCWFPLARIKLAE